MTDRPHDRSTSGDRPPAIAVFVTPHGFGHAARASAVLEELHKVRQDLRIHLFTTTPRWFFADSLTCEFTLHPLACDIGLVQKSSIEEDPEATAEALDRFLPFDEGVVAELSALLGRLECRLVMSDISPLGLAVARSSGIPSVLVESFTWDWIYAAYFDDAPRLREHARRIAEINAQCDLRIQTEPVCLSIPGLPQVPPVSRSPRTGRQAVRSRLDLADERPLVLLTMGGIEWTYEDLGRLRSMDDVAFVIPGGAETPRSVDNLRLLPHRSTFHHADLVAAADALVGKLGYSTVAEAYRAGAPFLYVQRPRFPETPHLADFVRTHLPAREITPTEFTTHGWLDHLPEILSTQRRTPDTPNGAETLAKLLAKRLDQT